MAKIMKSAFEMRTESDYEDFYEISGTEVELQVQEARRFVEEIERYLLLRINE